MINLVTFVIVAGMVIESHQRELHDSGTAFNSSLDEPQPVAKEVSLIPTKVDIPVPDWFNPSPYPVGGKPPCYHPTNIRCWTPWFDRDDPCGSGDSETLKKLRQDYPGKICAKPTGIQVQTLSGLTVGQTGDKIFRSDTFTGFICRNKDQPWKKCSDYRVRFSCHPPFCGGGVCWTDWYDRDNPSGTGDWELLSGLRKENPGQICDHPLYIEAATTDTNIPADATGEKFFVFDPTRGFVCRREDQKRRFCRDYKVRFGCPCKY